MSVGSVRGEGHRPKTRIAAVAVPRSTRVGRAVPVAPSLPVPPQGVHCREHGDPRGLGAQYSRTENKGPKSSAFRGRQFLRREAALGADHDSNRTHRSIEAAQRDSLSRCQDERHDRARGNAVIRRHSTPGVRRRNRIAGAGEEGDCGRTARMTRRSPSANARRAWPPARASSRVTLRAIATGAIARTPSSTAF